MWRPVASLVLLNVLGLLWILSSVTSQCASPANSPCSPGQFNTPEGPTGFLWDCKAPFNFTCAGSSTTDLTTNYCYFFYWPYQTIRLSCTAAYSSQSGVSGAGFIWGSTAPPFLTPGPPSIDCSPTSTQTTQTWLLYPGFYSEYYPGGLELCTFAAEVSMDGFGLYQPPCPYNCKCTNGYPGECSSCLPGSADVSTSCSYNSALCDQCLAKLDYYNTLHTGLCVADALEFTEFMEPLCAAATIGAPLCMGLIWGSYFEGCHLAGEVSTDFCSSPAMNSCPAGGRRSHNAQKILEKQQRHHLIEERDVPPTPSWPQDFSFDFLLQLGDSTNRSGSYSVSYSTQQTLTQMSINNTSSFDTSFTSCLDYAGGHWWFINNGTQCHFTTGDAKCSVPTDTLSSFTGAIGAFQWNYLGNTTLSEGSTAVLFMWSTYTNYFNITYLDDATTRAPVEMTIFDPLGTPSLTYFFYNFTNLTSGVPLLNLTSMAAQLQQCTPPEDVVVPTSTSSTTTTTGGSSSSTSSHPNDASRQGLLVSWLWIAAAILVALTR